MQRSEGMGMGPSRDILRDCTTSNFAKVRLQLYNRSLCHHKGGQQQRSELSSVYSGPGRCWVVIFILSREGREGGGAPGQHNARPGHRAADKMRNGPRISWSWCGHAVGGDTGRWPPGHSCQQNIHSHSCASFLISEQ